MHGTHFSHSLILFPLLAILALLAMKYLHPPNQPVCKQFLPHLSQFLCIQPLLFSKAILGHPWQINSLKPLVT